MADVPPYQTGLDPEVHELLVILGEECGEVAQRVGKVLRHGFRVNPYTGVPNRESLMAELTDIFTIVMMLDELGAIDEEKIFADIPEKLERLRRPGILHHSTMLEPYPCARCGCKVEFQKTADVDGVPIQVCDDEVACHLRSR